MKPFIFSQTTVLKFSFVDKDLEPVVHAELLQSDTSIYLMHHSNSEGIAYCKVRTDIPTNFAVSHASFESQRSFSPKIYAGKPEDTALIVVKMNFIRVHELPEFVVYAKGVPETVFGSKRVSVLDFEFLPNGDLLLLNYPKNPRKGTELVIYDGIEEKIQIPIAETGTELIKDYKRNPCVVTEKNIYGVITQDYSVRLEKIEKEYFNNYIKPIVDTSTSKLFFSNYNDLIPSFTYFSYDQNDSVYQKIIKVQDDFMMELFRSEFKWVDTRTKLWAKEKQNETGIDKEIWVGMSSFTNSPYYKKLYAPMFKRNDTLFLFDHYKSYLFHFDDKGNTLDSVPIFHHLQGKKSGWKKNILFDEKTGRFYCVYELDGFTYLRELNPVNGKVSELIKLKFRYIEKIAIHNNSAYFTYRPFESTQKKYLWREKLFN